MFKKDIELIEGLHRKYRCAPPLLDAGGLENPTIADYEISIKKAIQMTLYDKSNNHQWQVNVPHPNQSDRYLNITRPWQFIDAQYLILNPEYGHPPIEALPQQYKERFNTVIMVSVFEHVNNPYIVSDAIYEIIKPGGYLINSTPFVFPYHPSPEDNFRFSPLALRRIHEKSGFECIESDFHINYSGAAGIGDTNPQNYGAPQTVMACYALCRKRL
jgi:hypothetical protein